MVLIAPILARLRSPASHKRGQTLVEYALILAIVSVFLIAAFALLGQRVIVLFSAVANLLDTAQSSH